MVTWTLWMARASFPSSAASDITLGISTFQESFENSFKISIDGDEKKWTPCDGGVLFDYHYSVPLSD
jgi:hypothetical protein